MRKLKRNAAQPVSSVEKSNLPFALDHVRSSQDEFSSSTTGTDVKHSRFLPTPNSEIISAALDGGKLTIDPVDLVANSVTSNLYGQDFSAAAIVVLSLLYSEDTRTSILSDSFWRTKLTKVRSVKDVMELAAQLPPSFQSQLFKLIRNFRNKN